MQKWLKIFLSTVLGLFLLLILGYGYLYYQIEGRYAKDKEKYPHNIGYLPNTDSLSEFKRCTKDYPLGFFASAATYAPIFNGNKTTFKNYIQQNFIESDSTYNGFVNLRFIINCEGDIGNMEVNELDENYQPTNSSEKLVEHLVKLSSRKENWTVPVKDNQPRDSYMYLIYKIENGKIVEILP